MQSRKYTNKRSIESFILCGTTGLATSGTLMNTTTGNVNLNDGQVAFVAGEYPGGTVAANTIMDATPTVAEAASFYIAQGNVNSPILSSIQTNGAVTVFPYERTATINPKNIITVTKQVARNPSFATWVIGAPSAATSGKVSASDLTLFEVGISLKGQSVDSENGLSGNVSRIYYNTPNYTDLGYTDAQAAAHLLGNLVINANKQSTVLGKGNEPFAAFGLGTAGTKIATLTANTPINVMLINGKQYTFTPSADQVTALKAMATTSGHTHIVNLDAAALQTLTTAGMAVMALDRAQAYSDQVVNVKIGLKVGLTRGFDYKAVYNKQTTFADEGQNIGFQLLKQREATQKQRKYYYHSESEPMIGPTSYQQGFPIDPKALYTVFVIEHGTDQQIDSANISYSPRKEIVIFPEFLGAFAATITAFETALNSYLVSAGRPAIITYVP